MASNLPRLILCRTSCEYSRAALFICIPFFFAFPSSLLFSSLLFSSLLFLMLFFFFSLFAFFCRYPEVFEEFVNFVKMYGDVSVLNTRAFVMGLEVGEEGEFELETGKTLYVKLDAISEIDTAGYRQCYFIMNGQARTISVFDKQSNATIAQREVASKTERGSLGASINGAVVGIKVELGDRVKVGDPVVVLNAMKMEMVEASPINGVVKRITVSVGDSIQGGDLIAEIEEE